jgi:hypothetical protein
VEIPDIQINHRFKTRKRIKGLFVLRKSQKNNHNDHEFTFSRASRANPASITLLCESISQTIPTITSDIAFSHFCGQRYTNETFIIRLL